MAQTYKNTGELKGVINFTTTSKTKYICFRLGINSSGNTVTYKNIMLLKGTYTVDNIPAYEQYGAMPSPNYPSKIETVGSNTNLFDGELELGTLTNNSGADYGSTKNTRSKNYLAVEENTTYALSDNISGSFVVHAYNKDKTWIELIGSSNYTGKYIVTTPAQTAYIRFRTNETDLAAKIKLEKGSTITPYSPPGMGCVEIDVVNKNLALWNENNISFINVVNNSISNNVISVKGNEGMAALGYSGGVTKILFDRELRLNKSYTLSVKVKLLEQGKWSNQIQFWFGSNTSWNSETKVVELATNKYIICTFEFKCKIDKENTLIVYLNGNEIEIDLNSLQIEEGIKATAYVDHQSQTAIMPIQQEMLEGDYIKDVEHHEWGKLELTGEEEWFSNINTGWAQNEHIFGFSFSGIKTNGQTTDVGKVLICNYFECDNTSVLVDTSKNLISYYPFLREGSILINHQGISTLTDFKAWLKAKYDAGTPVVIYYGLANAIDLELTSEQKTVRNQKLYTYKNITNINVSDELASIDVEYKKDLETEHNKLQNEIDEIKQLISTTETSALLLDNLQKDVEMEVE